MNMFCRNCGNQILEGDKFCNKCGSSVLEKSFSNATNPERSSETNENHYKAPIESKQHDHTVCEKDNKRNTFIGLCWLIAPTLSLVVILSIYAIASFIITQSSGDLGLSGDYETISSIIRVILGLFGVVSVIGIMVGIPLGIISLNKQKFCSGNYDVRSGKGSASEIPKEFVYLGWNWGAAGLSFLWGMANRVWIAFLMFIPILNLFVIFYLGFKGNELAWRANKWESVEKFKEAQDKWRPWGILFFILIILSFVSSLASS